MRKNKGITIIEVIIVVASLSLVTMFFWTVLSSSTDDTSTITDKVEVQNSVIVLMNLLQSDVQQALPKISASGVNGIFYREQENLYIINGVDGLVRYEFDEDERTVKRIVGLTEEGEVESDSAISEHINITEFLVTSTSNSMGAEIRIVGGKNPNSEVDRSRYELNSTFYTRNTR